MKKIITIIAVLFSLNSLAQKKDSTIQKKDTVYVKTPVPVFERIDTIQIKGVLYTSKNGKVKVSLPAYAIAKGFKVVNERGQLKWTEQPQFVGILNNHKRPILKWLQIIQ